MLSHLLVPRACILSCLLSTLLNAVFSSLRSAWSWVRRNSRDDELEAISLLLTTFFAHDLHLAQCFLQNDEDERVKKPEIDSRIGLNRKERRITTIPRDLLYWKGDLPCWRKIFFEGDYWRPFQMDTDPVRRGSWPWDQRCCIFDFLLRLYKSKSS